MWWFVLSIKLTRAKKGMTRKRKKQKKTQRFYQLQNPLWSCVCERLWECFPNRCVYQDEADSGENPISKTYRSGVHPHIYTRPCFKLLQTLSPRSEDGDGLLELFFQEHRSQLVWGEYQALFVCLRAVEERGDS